MTAIIPCRWDGENFTPTRGHARRADEHFVVGLVYSLEPIEQRSAATHRHYFATINDMWQSLPDHLADRFPTAEHLRKHGLIMAGYRDETTMVASSRAEALRLAAFIRPIDEFQIVSVNGPIVVRWTAKSQNMRAMDSKTFAAIKTAVLDWISDLIGSHVGRAA